MPKTLKRERKDITIPDDLYDWLEMKIQNGTYFDFSLIVSNAGCGCSKNLKSPSELLDFWRAEALDLAEEGSSSH